MDTKLLIDLFKIPSQSGEEEKTRVFIKNFLDENDIPYKEDNLGNIFNIDNKHAPLLSAHMDTVQDDIDIQLTDLIKIRGDILKGYGVIGGDDKCGIFIILSILKSKIKINFIFSVMEEIGGGGIKNFIDNYELKNIPYGLILDRRGNDNIICERNDYGTKTFQNALLELGKKFKYKADMGTFSDADYINEQISCANLSVGYYNAHTKHEFVRLSDLEKAFNFVKYIIENESRYFLKPVKTYTYSYYGYDQNSHAASYSSYYCVFCQDSHDLFYSKTLRKYSCYTCANDFYNDFQNDSLDNECDKYDMNNEEDINEFIRNGECL